MIKSFCELARKTSNKPITSIKPIKRKQVFFGFNFLLAMLLIWLIYSLTAYVFAEAASSSADKLLSAVGINSRNVQRLLGGEIQSYSISEPTKRSFSNGVVMYVKARPSLIVEAIRHGALLAKDPDVLGYGIFHKALEWSHSKGFYSKKSNGRKLKVYLK